jgi:hypothetical protein
MRMGGIGSGRWSRWDTKRTVESCRAIDIRLWQRQGLLTPGMRFNTRWHTAQGEPTGAISVQVEAARVRLTYDYRQGDAPWQAVEASLALTWTRCHYGGQRPWIRCPGVAHGHACGRRVAIVYGAGWSFLCRHCADLVYTSQREDAPSRLITTAQKIRRRLGGHASLLDPFPPKPKGMHWRTYVALAGKAQRAEAVGLETVVARFERRGVRLR